MYALWMLCRTGHVGWAQRLDYAGKHHAKREHEEEWSNYKVRYHMCVHLTNRMSRHASRWKGIQASEHLRTGHQNQSKQSTTRRCRSDERRWSSPTWAF